MALPKRKHSKARRDKSRTHWKLKGPTVTRCPQCAKPIRSHQVCPYCGTYRGRHVVTIPEKKPKSSSS